MRVVSLGSGSSGNALLVEAGPNGRTKLLVDAGFSERILRERLRSVGVTLSQIQGILITHEHVDHILGLSTIMKRYATPVVADPRTLDAIEQVFTTGILRSESGALVSLETEEGIDPTEHVLINDSGEVTPTMLEAMNQADLLILESNHDRERLLRGPYPYALKQRILSSTGHLSNDQAAEAVLRTWRTDAVRWLWLSHLSRTNNTPKLALQSMRTRIQEAKVNLGQVHISVLPHTTGAIWDSTQLWHAPSLWEMQL